MLGAWLYTLLSGQAAALINGLTLIATAALAAVFCAVDAAALVSRVMRPAPCSGVLVALRTTGSGAILLSLLMATGLEGAAVIATDSLVSVAIGRRQARGRSAMRGVITPIVLAIGLLIRRDPASSTFIARLIVERMPVHVTHTAILDVVVIAGAAIMIFGRSAAIKLLG